MKKKLTILAVLALLAVIPASAGTFLQFMQNGTNPTPLIITDNMSAGGVAPSVSTTISVTSAPVSWDFLVTNALGTSARTGLLTFTATTTIYAVTTGGGNLIEHGFSGSGSITDSLTNTVALSWVFGPTGTVTVGGTTGSFIDSTPGATEVVFSSPYLTFASGANEAFALSLTNAFAAFSTDQFFQGQNIPITYCTDCRIASDSAAIGGTFSADAPEPATMALFGSALVGLGLLGRKRFSR